MKDMLSDHSFYAQLITTTANNIDTLSRQDIHSVLHQNEDHYVSLGFWIIEQRPDLKQCVNTCIDRFLSRWAK